MGTVKWFNPTEIVEKSQTLLKNPSPDTFLGRQHYEIIPLPEQE
jgi:hypothetical protein